MNETQQMTGKEKRCIPNDTAENAVPVLMTESELIDFLRIPEVSKAKDHHNVIANLKRFHDLPRVHICGQPLYPRDAIVEWIRDNTNKGK